VRKTPPSASEGVKDLDMGQPFVHAESARGEHIRSIRMNIILPQIRNDALMQPEGNGDKDRQQRVFLVLTAFRYLLHRIGRNDPQRGQIFAYCHPPQTFWIFSSVDSYLEMALVHRLRRRHRSERQDCIAV
jgi:hypothetical protein